jgi:hypothetical protein
MTSYTNLIPKLDDGYVLEKVKDEIFLNSVYSCDARAVYACTLSSYKKKKIL